MELQKREREREIKDKIVGDGLYVNDEQSAIKWQWQPTTALGTSTKSDRKKNMCICMWEEMSQAILRQI